MPIENVLFLAAVLTAFTVFGMVVAWVDRIAKRHPDQQPAE